MNKIKLLLLVIGLTISSFAFAGEFGDHCTTGLSKGSLIKTKCEINELYKGKTYCFGNQAAKDAFLLDPDNTIAKASAFYAKNKEVAREKISQADALKQINSKTCDLSNKEAGYLIFNGLDLSHCNMQNVSFFGAELMGAKLIGANLQGAYLNLARLENADFSKANLTDAIIFQAIFDKTNFAGANLSNARMIGTLGSVNMSNANIKKGRFGLDLGNQPMGQMKFDSVGGNFAGANFEGADLGVAAFRFGNLRGANLRNTNMYRADLIKADLTGADLTGANLTDAEVDDAIFKDVKGLETTKGFNTVKGKCIDCTVAAPTPVTEKKATDNMMTAENPATKVCNIRGARY
ncbi:MAG: pentapeptide repeat-containing protein [Methylotenera sp.]